MSTRRSYVSASIVQNELHEKRPENVELLGNSGRSYSIKKILQEKEFTKRRVYLAVSNDRRFIVKEVAKPDFSYYRDIYRSLQSPYLRRPSDTVPKQSLLVFPYFRDHLLRMAPQMDLPIHLTKRVLRDVLNGIAALHEQDIVHTDIKANNIFIDWKIPMDDSEMIIDKVQLADIEDAVHLPSNRRMVGKQVGNYMWRSPEAHAQGPIGKSADMFSFGVVCIYAILKEHIFSMDENKLPEGVEPLSVILERQLSYFGTAGSLNGLFAYLGDENPWCLAFKKLWEGFSENNPRKPFWMCQDIDEGFRDLVCSLMDIDPAKRIMAQEALKHPWFKG